MPNDYAHARRARKAQQKLGTPKTDMWIEPESAPAAEAASTRPSQPKHEPKEALKPKHLLNEENHYDKNTYTPEQMLIRKNPRTKPELSRA